LFYPTSDPKLGEVSMWNEIHFENCKKGSTVE